jgi:hypothetical protein
MKTDAPLRSLHTWWKPDLWALTYFERRYSLCLSWPEIPPWEHGELVLFTSGRARQSVVQVF